MAMTNIFETAAKEGSEPGLSRLRVRRSTAELPHSTCMFQFSGNVYQ